VKPWVLPAGIAALAALALVWFFSAYERVPAKEWVGPSGEARRNPFLAAERLAQRMGLASRQLRALPELDRLPAGAVLLLPNQRQAIDPRRIRELVSWAEAGGHLIAEAELPGVPDALYERLSVQRRPGARLPKPLAVEMPGAGRLQVSLHDAAALQLPAEPLLARAAIRESVKLAAFQRGKGVVTVTTSLQFARNSLIGEHDNAEFLWELLGLTPAAELHVYLRPERLSLWGFLKEHAAPVLAAGAVLAALWLWHVGPRFGPVAPDAPPGRRRLLDHLRASGRYYWARGLRPRLVGAARDAALRRVARAHPDFATGSPTQRAARLAALVGMPASEAERFMREAETVSGVEFIHLMHTAQRVHRALEKGNR
jgi:hypothetical protein